MIKNVILDIGNVLVDFAWEKTEREIIREYAKKQGETSPERIEELFLRFKYATVDSPTWKEYDRGIWTEEQVVDSFVERAPELEEPIRTMGKSFEKMLVRMETSVPWIDLLHTLGYKVYYLSNYSATAVRDAKGALDFMPHTDGGFLSYTVHLLKPQKAYYEMLLEEYELEASECVFFDDMERNILGALKCGIRAYVFENIEQAMGILWKLRKEG